MKGTKITWEFPRDLQDFLPIKDPQKREMMDRLKENILKVRAIDNLADDELLVEDSPRLVGLSVMTRRRCVCSKKRKERGPLSHPPMRAITDHDEGVVAFARLNPGDEVASCPYGAKRGAFYETIQDFVRTLAWGCYMVDYNYSRDRVEFHMDDEIAVFDYSSRHLDQVRSMLSYIAQDMPGVVEFLFDQKAISRDFGISIKRLARAIRLQTPLYVRFDLLWEDSNALPLLLAVMRPERDEEGQPRFKLFASAAAFMRFLYELEGEQGAEKHEKYNWLYSAPIVALHASAELPRHLTANRTVCACHLRRSPEWLQGREEQPCESRIHVPIRWKGQRRIAEYFSGSLKPRKAAVSPKMRATRHIGSVTIPSPRDTLSDWPQCLECIPMNWRGQRDIRKCFGLGKRREPAKDRSLVVVIKTKVRALTTM